MKNIKKAILPVAGFGTRFLPASKSIPKEMFPIVDKPLIHFAVEEVVSSGFKEIVFVINHFKNSIVDYFDKSSKSSNELLKKSKGFLKYLDKVSKKNIKFHFVYQKKPMGVGHAILQAEKIIKKDPFAVIFPDDLIKSKSPCIAQMMKIYHKYESSIIAVEKVNRNEVSNYGIIDYSKKTNRVFKIKSIDEKPKIRDAKSNLAVVGRFILSPSIFSYLKKTKPGHGNEIQLTDAIDSLLSEEDVYGYNFSGLRFDCGSKIGFLKATIDFAKDHPSLKKEFINYMRTNKF
tara:strand:+ start:109 stop:975 length:867 start_codon:yes stop_codon:yes gene_type:complete